MPSLSGQTLPKYLSISQHLRRRIIDEKLQPGTRLEAQAKLAQNYGVSLLTARQALGKLEKEGFIEQRPGQGTFVVRNAAISQVTSSGDVGLLMVDNTGNPTRTNAYYMSLIRHLGEVLSVADYDLKVATVTDAAFKHRQPHGMLDRRRVRAVVVDGFISQLHIDLIRGLGLDLLVVGNHAVGDDVPQVRHDVRQAAYEISKAMIALNHGPVVLFTEPYRYHYTTEILLGYQQAMYEVKQYPIAFSAHADALDTWAEIMEMVYQQQGDRFCVMSMLRVTDLILGQCRLNPLNVQRIPTCILGNPYIDNKELQPWVIACEMSASDVGRAVGDSLVAALDSGGPISSTVFEPVVKGLPAGLAENGWPISCSWRRRA